MSEMRVAVIGAGISGLVAATELAKGGAKVVLYEKEDYLGGHAKTVTVDGCKLDLGFMVFNRVTYPNMMEFFESLGVEMEESDMSFSVSLDKGQGCEWGSRNGLSSLFAQKKNVLNPYFWQMIREISKFKDDVLRYLEDLENNPDIDRNETLGHFIKSRSYSDLFQNAYLVPICASIWSCPSEGVMSFSAYSVLSFCRNHHLLQVREQLESRGCHIRSGCEVHSVSPTDGAAWSAWNFLGTMDKKACLTYWLNVLQNIRETELPYLVTLNPSSTPDHTLLKWSTGHPAPSVAASKASIELDLIQGRRGIWFCGAYQGYGFHEDGLKAGLVAAHGMLRKSCAVLNNPKHMVPSLMETGARLFVTRFLGQYISTGCLIKFFWFHSLLEEGGTVFTFEGEGKKCLLRTSLRVHSPQFYWKVATQADLGLADAYINGDFSLVNKNEGLQNLFMIFIANRDLKNSFSKKRGWWTPLLFTACIGSAKYFFRHVSRQNTLTQARRNISRHYDLSNELFALFLDESMTYSCAVFKSEDEELKVAQMRKISLLIEKARIDKEHEILEIGCGWGSLAIEVVKRTGCKYTGITLSEEQLRFAEMKVNEAGLQDRIKFLLCDYRQLPDTYKYDRIISCEMIEAVGHEYMEEFFGCCDSVLAENGLLVLQFISIPDERYDEYRQSSDFIREYIFPGGCLPSLSRITSAMAASSRLCAIIALGFNEKFIRTWEYYFDYCAAGFKSNTLGNYQIVFSRPGNVCALGNPYKGIPSAY
ncbi:hypothetical protein RHMOL_Rhmol04G0283500 [Rhododendron molle]|uniref:Uncharacterized protein n=1 Tax=Rhododendron molle TaxID=49168 RepID=A0ACC0P5B7_RHOML|nr:hypothetical protein RHMOL_Rhmol04G0283500 [Rhododendron molle]